MSKIKHYTPIEVIKTYQVNDKFKVQVEKAYLNGNENAPTKFYIVSYVKNFWGKWKPSLDFATQETTWDGSKLIEAEFYFKTNVKHAISHAEGLCKMKYGFVPGGETKRVYPV